MADPVPLRRACVMPVEAVAGPQRTAAMVVAFLDRAPAATPDELLDLARTGAAELDIAVLNLFLVDMEQRQLKPFPGSVTDEPQGIDATIAGRAYRAMRPVRVSGNGEAERLFLPLLNGSERLGVLELDLGDDTGGDQMGFTALARLLAEAVVSKRMYGDAVARTRRQREMQLAAEIQWELLPPLTLMAKAVSISGILEPCYEIGGDVFDYSLNGPFVHLFLCDAMGHGLDSSVMASLLVGAYRNCRRAGWGLPATYRRMDELVAERFGPERFATAQFGVLDGRDGTLRWVNSGHPAPMLARRGKVVGRLEQPPYLPIGFGDGVPAVAQAQLEPGDRMLWFTDGVVEARSPEGDFFGDDRLADLLERAIASGEPAPEIARRLTHAVLDHQAGTLRDDATILLVTWDEPFPRELRSAG